MIYPEFQKKNNFGALRRISICQWRYGRKQYFSKIILCISQISTININIRKYFSKIILCISQISRQWEIAERGQRDCFMGPRSGRDQVRCYFQEEVNISNKNVNFCWTVDKNVNFCWIVDKEKAIMAGSGKMLLSERENSSRNVKSYKSIDRYLKASAMM